MIGNGSGNGLWMAAGVTVVLIAAGVYLSTRGDGVVQEGEVTSVVAPAQPPQVSGTPLPDQPPVDAPEAAQGETTAQDATTGAVAENQQALDAAVVPTFDEVRVDGSGVMVIAGRASPGVQVEVLVDGEVVATSDTDATGSFAALGTLDESADARLLTLRVGEGDAAVASDEEIILAPITAPQTEAVVAAAPEPEAVAEPDALAPSDPTAQAAAEAQAGTPEDSVVAALPETAPAAPPAPAPAASEADTAAATPPKTETEETALDGADPAAQVAASQPQDPKPDAQEAAEAPAVAVLRSDDTGVALVPSAPPPAQTVVLDTIGYSDAGDVQLGGRAAAGTVEVRAYLNNRAVARLPVDEDGNWRGDVPEVDAGVYTLRVDALAADGSVASRVETPFKREEPEVLAAATANSDGPVRAVTVQAGDTLWAIARDRYGEGLLYVQVFEANRASIRDPDLIYPGQVFDLPSD